MAQWPSHWVLGSPSSHQDNREAGLLQITRSWPGPLLLQEGEWGEAEAEYGFPRAPHGQDFCYSGMLLLKKLTFHPINLFERKLHPQWKDGFINQWGHMMETVLKNICFILV